MASLTFMLFCVWILGALAFRKDKSLKLFPNIGVAFEKVGSIQTTTSYWNHVFIKRLHTPDDFRPVGKSSGPELKDLARMAKDILDFARLRFPTFNEDFRSGLFGTTTMDDMIKIRDSVNYLSKQSGASTMDDVIKIRDSVNNLSKQSGATTMDDVIKLRDSVNNLLKQGNAMSSQLRLSTENMVSYTKVVNERMENITSKLRDENEMIDAIWDRFVGFGQEPVLQRNLTKNILRYRAERSIALSHARSTMTLTKKAIEEIGRGKLSETIISYKDFQLVLNELEKVESQMGDGFHFLITDPFAFYENAKFFVFMNGTDMWITLRLPVGENKPSNLFRIHTWNVPIYNGSAHSTQIQGLSEYAAIYDNYHLASLSSKDIHQCVGKKTLLCPFDLYLKQLDGSSCLSSIWSGVSAAVHSACDFVLKADSIKPSMKQITANKVLVQDISSLKIMCGRQSRVHQGCHSCILEVPCGCRIVASEQLYIVPTQVDCSKVGSVVARTSMSNFAVLRTFLNHSLAAKVNYKRKFANADKLSKIKFKTLDAHFKETSRKDAKVNKRIRDIIEEENIIERQDHELAFASRSSWNMSFLKTPSFVINSFVLILIIGLIVVLVSFREKYRKHRTEDERSIRKVYYSLKGEIDLLAINQREIDTFQNKLKECEKRIKTLEYLAGNESD